MYYVIINIAITLYACFYQGAFSDLSFEVLELSREFADLQEI